jgi:hypothetical protein
MTPEIAARSFAALCHDDRRKREQIGTASG